MPDISERKATATCYPPNPLYSEWQNHAERLNMSGSQFIIRMVEAGRKQVDLQQTTSDSYREFRQQHADLKQELEHQRERNRDLERQLHHTAYADILSCVEDNPGATTPEIIQHIADTIPGRVVGHLDMLEGDKLEFRDGAYYLEESSPSQTSSATTQQ